MLSNKLKLQFIKDYDLPIEIVKEKYFEYFLNLYENDLKSNTKYKNFCKEVSEIGGEEKYLEIYNDIIKNCFRDIKENESYKKLEKDNLKKLSEIPLKTYNLYSFKNDNKMYISIKLKDANFQALMSYDKQIVKNELSYSDFISSYTDLESIKNSKNVKKLITNYLSTKKLDKLKSNLLNLIYNNLISLGINKEDIFLFKDETNFDELLIKIDNITNKEMILLEDIQYFCNVNKIDVDLSIFKLEKISQNKDFYLKRFLYGNRINQIEYCNISEKFFAQIYKIEKGLELIPVDRAFYCENQIAFFGKFLEL